MEIVYCPGRISDVVAVHFECFCILWAESVVYEELQSDNRYR